jgi:transcription elongation GreA/GreB family factor
MEQKKELIRIGDMLRVQINDGLGIDEMLVNLVDDKPDFHDEYMDISIESPLGKSIVGSFVGEEKAYDVKGNTTNIMIMEKVTKELKEKIEKEEDSKTK